MMWLIAFITLALLSVAIMIWDEANNQASNAKIVDNYFDKVYKDEPDWSLMAKGYSVVNDTDIQYTEWLAANPGKVI